MSSDSKAFENNYNKRSPSWLAGIEEKCLYHDFHTAIEELNQIDPHEPLYDIALKIQARCFLATNQYEQAQKAYKAVLAHSENPAIQTEALLVLDEIDKAVKTFQKNKTDVDAEHCFIAALSLYKYGYIQQARQQIEHALEQGFEWQDDSLIDAIAQTVLTGHYFFDFEQIYLDAENEPTGERMNRWFHLNIPVIELLSSSQGKPQTQKAIQLAQILGATARVIENRHGRLFLSEIINDLAASEVDARFGLEAKKIIQKDDYKELARLVLALLLEHTKQFAELVGLKKETIPQYDLQKLVLALPLRMATAILVLYALGEKESTQLLVENNQLDRDIVAGLIGLSFKNYYSAVNRYRSIET
jgi:tetratricopeptide (TPR) repeat protein